MSGVAIIRAGVENADAIAGIHVEAWRETYRDVLPDAMLASFSVERRAHAWRSLLADPGQPGRMTALLALQDGLPVGFGACCIQRDGDLSARGYSAEIAAIYLLRHAHGSGLGRRLMAGLARILVADGHHALSLWVLKANARARGFYEHIGGIIVSERIEQRGEIQLPELAYGWDRLAGLVDD